MLLLLLVCGCVVVVEEEECNMAGCFFARLLLLTPTPALLINTRTETMWSCIRFYCSPSENVAFGELNAKGLSRRAQKTSSGWRHCSHWCQGGAGLLRWWWWWCHISALWRDTACPPVVVVVVVARRRWFHPNNRGEPCASSSGRHAI